MKVDRLFVEKNCPHCGVIRAALNIDAVMDDDFRGADGQKFYVFSSLSNEASLELMDKFKLKGTNMPVLVTHEGEKLTSPKKIASYLQEQGMA
jgi:hypothetical protein